MEKQILAFVSALQMTVCFAAETVYPEEFPEGLTVNAKLNQPDGTVNGTMYCSLTSGYQYYNWSDGEAITGDKKEKIYYIPSGMKAQTTAANQDVVPVIYSSGRVYPRASSNKTTTFTDLRLLGGGCLEHAQVGKKLGNIAIQAYDPNNPALLSYAFPEVYDYSKTFQLGARIVGPENSQLLYTCFDKEKDGKGFLCLVQGSDWSEFKGVLHIDDGFGIMSFDAVPVVTPGTVRFRDGGILMMTNNASYSFGNLSFEEEGMIANTGAAQFPNVK